MEKSIIDNLLEKATQTKFAFPPRSSVTGGKGGGKDYDYDPEKQEVSVSTFENGSQKRLDKRVLATTKENEKKLKNASTESDLVKSTAIIVDGPPYADSFVLLSDSDKEAKKKQKPTPKAPGHTLGCDPLDKRESYGEMVRIKAKNLSNKSEDSDLVKSIDAILEKASKTRSAQGGHDVIEQREKPGISPTSSVEKRRHGKQTRYADYRYNSEKGTVGVSKEIEGRPSSSYRHKDVPISDEKKLKYASIESNLVKSIDAILEKAVYGSGASAGKFQVGTHKNPAAHGAVKKPELSEERKKEILSGVKAKATSQASGLGLHKRAAEEASSKSVSDPAYTVSGGILSHDFKTYAPGSKEDKEAHEKEKKYMDNMPKYEASSKSKYGGRYGPSLQSKLMSKKVQLPKETTDRLKSEGKSLHPFDDMMAKRKVEEGSNKSLDERTADLVKSLNVDYGRRKSGSRANDSRQDPDAGIEREKDRKMDADEAKPERKLLSFNDYHDLDYQKKSLDERTCDLVKDFAPEKVGGAVGREYVKNPDSDRAKRVAVKFHGKNANNSAAQSAFSEGLTNEVWAHNEKLSKKSLQAVCNTWQTDSAYITKGARVEVQGGKPATLVKDEDEDSGAE